MRRRHESRRRTRLPLLGREIGNACRLPGAARIWRIDVDADGRTCGRRRSDRVQHRLEIEYGDDESGQVAPPVGDRGSRSALGVDRNGDEHADGPNAVLRFIQPIAQRCDHVVVARAFERRPPLGGRRIIQTIDHRGLRFGGKEDGIVLVTLRRGRDAAIRIERFDPVAGNSVGDRRGLVFRALLPVDAREPGNTEDAGVALEQPSGESLEFAARDFLVGRLEQGAQRDQPADIFVHAVLHDDRLGLGDTFELDPGNPLLPLADGICSRQRQYETDCHGHRRRIAHDQPRRQPTTHRRAFMTGNVRIPFAHVRLLRSPHAPRRNTCSGVSGIIGHRLALRTRQSADAHCPLWEA